MDLSAFMLDTLQKYFGYTQFRPLQQEIITTVLNKQDVFVLMPTGGGKSMCYQLPSVLLEGITIVVSPLISLMKDQVDSLLNIGIHAAYINSSLTYEEIAAIKARLQRGEMNLLYAAPERLMMDSFIGFMENLNIALFAIDEAHCISEWGHDFRPEYRGLELLKRKFPDIPVIALTATATPIVQEDIIHHLGLNHPRIFKASFNRENLFYKIIPKEDTYRQLCNYLEEHADESGIIYCHTRKTVDDLTANLRRDGYRALAYHAGMEKNERTKNQEAFIKDDVNIIVATIAFGMGIDKSNVRYVIHYDLPKNLEGYYQETGRAGRDGLKSDCILFYNYGDRYKIDYFINEKEDPKEREIAYEKLQQIIAFCETSECRRINLLMYFGESYPHEHCDNCDNCLLPKETVDGTIPAQKLLSCVARVRERFGVNYIIDVLRGSKNERIIQNQHNHLSTYGIGVEYNKKQWQLIARELIRLGYLQVEGDEYPVLKLTEKSNGALMNKERIFITKFRDEAKVMPVSTKETFNHELFNQLRDLRKRIADEESVPPYVVFSDNTLRGMATSLPLTWESLQGITGVGEFKLKRYGPRFLKVIMGFCQQHGIDTAATARRKRDDRQLTRSRTEYATLELLKMGMTIEKAALVREISPSTVVTHIEKLIYAGESISIDRFVPSDKQLAIRKAFVKFGNDRLAPVKEYLGKNYSYDDIRLMRAKVLME